MSRLRPFAMPRRCDLSGSGADTAAASGPSGSLRFPDGLREIYLKLEVLQPIGSFKIRGAYNVVRQLTPEQLKDGVWTVSAETPPRAWPTPPAGWGTVLGVW
jgi:hypothetical protein